MKNKEIPPFYFPSMVMFIDDNRDFLENMSLRLDTGLAFRLCDSPVKALATLNGLSEQPSLIERFFSVSHHDEDIPLSRHVIELNLKNILREVHNEHRFEQFSVVVVDYDMPEINGLELCRSLNNPLVKKILLTGKADEKVAVQAFNQGLIDRFIQKQDPDIGPILNRAIIDLQLAYFDDLGRMVMDALELGSHSFLRDPAFIEEFRKICNKHNIVEYYLTSMPDGILMLDAKGTPSLMIVKNEENMLSHFEIAYDQAAPPDLLNALRSNEMVPYFWRTHGEYGPYCQDWESYLFPATQLKGRELYYYTVIPNSPGLKLDSVISYNQFLAWLDRQGNSFLKQTCPDTTQR